MCHRTNRILLGAILALSVVVAPASRGEEGHGHDGAAHEESGPGPAEQGHSEHGGDVVRLSAAQLTEFEIELGRAQSGRVARTVTLPGEVRPNQDRLAHIAPRFPGMALEVRKRVGDRVEAGETLAIIESSASLAPYPLKSAIAGVVIERHITRGEPVSQERGRAFTVGDLSDVWIDISVYQKHLPYVAVGQAVTVSAGHGLFEATGSISYVSPVIDEETRTATARVVLPNPDGVWRPGLFVSAAVELEHLEAAVAVPYTAIEVVEGSPVVFVKDDDGFEARPISLGLKGKNVVEVTQGLAAGELYVTRGGFTLKSELAREELSGGHSH